jgi:hypothetical protein
MSARLAPLLVALAALTSLAGTGCSLLTAPPVEQLVNECGSQDDCGPGSTCDTAHHMCVASTPPTYGLRVEITPATDPLGGTPLPMLFDLGRAGELASPELVLPVPAVVEGTARLDGDPVSAQLTFTPRVAPGTLVGAVPSGSVSVRASASTNGRVDFVTQLPVGTYDVFVEPLAEFRPLLPPIYAILEVPDGAGVSFDVPYDSDDLVEVRGVVQDPGGVGQSGLLVRAIDPATGRTLSSATSTDDDGSFVLVMSRSVTSFSFRVRGDTTRQGSGALFPKLTIDASTLLPAMDGSFVLLVPSSDRALRLVGTVELPPSLGQNRPAVGAQVRLRSSYVNDPDTGLTGSLELDLTTNAAGRFEGFVLPGTYQVEIFGADEEVGVLVDELEVAPNPASMVIGQVFTLPTRSILGGTVQLVDGEPVSGARLRASALGVALTGASRPEAVLNRSAMGLSGSMGEFRLPLDVGVYDLAVEMPAETRYAWHVERGFGVGGSDAPLRRVMSVRAPFRVEASARFADDMPVAGGVVRLFAIDEETGRLTEIGATIADDDGAFLALLPPSID